MPDFKFDAKALINAMLMARAKQENNITIMKLIEVFEKYGLSMMDGIELILEVAAILDITKSEESEDDGNV